jgi:hypothetical protein
MGGSISAAATKCHVNLYECQMKISCLKKLPDTVGEFKSAEMCVSHMPSWKAKKLGKLTQEKVLLEL